MIDYQLLAAVFAGIALLLFLILVFKIHAFLSLLISSISVGILAGMPAGDVIATVQKGMGGTLGFVATVIGLGALFGAILEQSGGAKSIAKFLVSKSKLSRAPYAMAMTGFLVAIPVFFDVAFILLIPMVYALQRTSGKSLLLFAIPLLSGLAVTHAFIPPTPGPIAVADILGADLGWVILTGFVVGLPVAIISGPIFGKYIANKINVVAPMADGPAEEDNVVLPSFSSVLGIVCIPLVLILLNTSISAGFIPIKSEQIKSLIALVGHPFTALIIANLVAWYFMGIRRGFSKQQLLQISSKSLAPAGSIILITGAGGVFKQVLIETGAGEMIANSLAGTGLSVLLFAYLVAFLVRILQGSSTVAMITAASLVAPLIESSFSGLQLACLVTAIAAGASATSHVNDSGFWLVNQYLGLTEKQTFRSWTVMTTILSVSGLFFVSIIWWLAG